MAAILTYIIADDDEIYRDYTLGQLNAIPGLQCLAVCENAMTTREQLQDHQPDLLLLDVEMPGLSGIQLAKSLKQLPFIIFITSHPQYAADAFELDAVDYLVKPVPPERMLRAIDKVKNLASMKASTSTAEGFQLKDKDSFFIKDKNVFVRIAFSDVVYAQSLGDFVNLFLQNGDKKIVLVNMKNLEQQLPAELFIRISRTYIVNRQKITAVENEQVYLDKIHLTIGKTYSGTVLKSIVGDQVIKRFI
jgi:two-component system, LytTR family, response regulator